MKNQQKALVSLLLATLFVEVWLYHCHEKEKRRTPFLFFGLHVKLT
jgi:hypothetical protein